MPLRPSTQSIGSTLGRRLFGTDNASTIQRKIQSIDKDKLRAALKAQGINGGMTARRIAETLTGKNGAGSAHQLGKTVKALQSTGATVENDAHTGRLMMESTKRAIQDEQMKVSDRPTALSLGAKSSINSRIAEARMAREGVDTGEKPLENARSIREIRETLKRMGIADRRIVPKGGAVRPGTGV